MKRFLLILLLGAASVLLSWSAVKGDVTGDGKIDVEDVNATINIILEVKTAADYQGEADVTGDGKVDVEDVNREINYILGLEEPEDDKVDVGVYMGIVGFNQALYTKPVSMLNKNTKGDFTRFVNGMTSKNGTLLYWAVDNALDMIKAAPTPKDLSDVVLVTFTDGLDQGSMMMTDRYTTNEAYLSALHSRVTSKYKGLPLTAFSIGLRGTDVTDTNLFRQNLKQLASSDDNAYEVSDMSEVNTRLQAIADRVASVTRKQDITVTIPGQANGTRIRFTFDGVSDAANSSLYIEGTFQLSDRSLRNVTYVGMTATSGSTVKGTQDGIFVTFKFTGLRRQSTGEILPTGNIRQWSYVTGSGQWQRNSEFTPESNTEVTVTNTSALVVLALDCSSSLGSQFSTMLTNVTSFIETMAAVAPKPQPTIEVSWAHYPHYVKAGCYIPFTTKYYNKTNIPIDRSEVWTLIKRDQTSEATSELTSSLIYTKSISSSDTVSSMQLQETYAHNMAKWDGHEYVLNDSIPTSYTLAPHAWVTPNEWNEEMFNQYYPSTFKDEFVNQMVTYLTRDSVYYNDLRNIYIKYDFTIEQFVALNQKYGVEFPTETASDKKSDAWFVTDEVDHYYYETEVDGVTVIKEINTPADAPEGVNVFEVYKSSPWLMCRYSDSTGGRITYVRREYMPYWKELISSIPFEDWIYNTSNKSYAINFTRSYSLIPEFRVYDINGNFGITTGNNGVVFVNE